MQHDDVLGEVVVAESALTRECFCLEATMHEHPEAEPSSSCSMAATRCGRVVDDVEVHHHSKHPATRTHIQSMSSTPLQTLWDASASQPFSPTISKEQQFTVGFVLLFAALVLTGLFGMSMLPEIL
jgi:hypothetical protein